MPLDPSHQVRAVEGLLGRLAKERFFGEVVIRIEGGNLLYARIQQIRRIEDLAAEEASLPTGKDRS